MISENPLLSLFGMLGSVVLILVLAYCFTRYVVGNGGLGELGMGQRNEHLRVLAQTPVGKDQRLAVIQAGERYFVVGMTPQNITLLSELTAEEASLWTKNTSRESAAALSGFQQTFMNTWQKRKRGEEPCRKV